jgi:hypothetical protein
LAPDGRLSPPEKNKREQTKQPRAERTSTNLAARTTPEVTWERAGKGGLSSNKIRDLEVIAVGKAQSALALSETFTTASEQDTPCRNDLQITNCETPLLFA